MRALWAASGGGPISEADIAARCSRAVAVLRQGNWPSGSMAAANCRCMGPALAPASSGKARRRAGAAPRPARQRRVRSPASRPRDACTAAAPPNGGRCGGRRDPSPWPAGACASSTRPAPDDAGAARRVAGGARPARADARGDAAARCGHRRAGASAGRRQTRQGRAGAREAWDREPHGSAATTPCLRRAGGGAARLVHLVADELRCLGLRGCAGDAAGIGSPYVRELEPLPPAIAGQLPPPRKPRAVRPPCGTRRAGLPRPHRRRQRRASAWPVATPAPPEPAPVEPSLEPRAWPRAASPPRPATLRVARPTRLSYKLVGNVPRRGHGDAQVEWCARASTTRCTWTSPWAARSRRWSRRAA